MNPAFASSKKVASEARRETSVHAHQETNVPWFRHRMVWLVIAIPALTVAGCALTIFLALTNPDQLVGEPDATEDSASSASR